MNHTMHRTRLALLASCGLVASGSLMAQSADRPAAQAHTSANHQLAHEDARAADRDARAARAAAEAAAAEQRAGALTEAGAAQAEYSAWVADQASRRAEQAAQDARHSANQAGAARAVVDGGTVHPAEATVRSRQAAGSASSAGEAARQAAVQAEVAAETARVARNTPPADPIPARQPPAETYPSVQQVTITSSPPDSVVGQYRIDMAALDRNGDGRLTRTEAAPNPTLSAEFAAVDTNGDGVLDRSELKGWLR